MRLHPPVLHPPLLLHPPGFPFEAGLQLVQLMQIKNKKLEIKNEKVEDPAG
jgi:hypothetical protein